MQKVWITKRKTPHECRIYIPEVKPMVSTIRRYELTDAEWERFKPYIPEEQEAGSREGLLQIPGKCSMESAGFSEVELPGGIFLNDTALGKPCINGSWSGLKPDSSRRSLRIWLLTRTCRISALTAPVSRPIKQVQVQKEKSWWSQNWPKSRWETREIREKSMCWDHSRRQKHQDSCSGGRTGESDSRSAFLRGYPRFSHCGRRYGSRRTETKRDYRTGRQGIWLLWIQGVHCQSGCWFLHSAEINSVDPWYCDFVRYKERHVVECFFNKLKENRRIATRFDKLAHRFLAFVHLGCIRILLAWLCSWIEFRNTP